MGKRLVFILLLTLLPPGLAAAAAEVTDAVHVPVRHEPGCCFGWPANGRI